MLEIALYYMLCMLCTAELFILVSRIVDKQEIWEWTGKEQIIAIILTIFFPIGIAFIIMFLLYISGVFKVLSNLPYYLTRKL